VSPRVDLSALDGASKDALILALMERVEALVAENAMLRGKLADLEAKLGKPPKTPDNSSLPPSAGHKPSGEAAPGRPPRKSHPGANRPLHPDPTRKRDVLAEHCAHCGADVSAIAQKPVSVYDRIEIPEIRPDVTQVTLYGGKCPCCAKKFTAVAPPGLEPGSPFGPNFRAFVFYLRFTQGIALKRLARLLHDLFGVEISEGALVNMLRKSCTAFARRMQAIRERLLCSTALESDETSVRVGKKNWWLWVFHHKDDAAFVIKPSRGKDVVKEFLGEARPQFWVSDRLGAQMGWATREHQVCLAHLIRDAQFAIDAGDCIFAPLLRKLLKRACAIGQRRENLSDATLRSHAARLDRDLTGLLQLEPNTVEGRKLQTMVKRYRQHFFTFVTNRDLPATNNGSERALRPCAVFRKITNGFRTQWGADLYADIRSVVETARRRAINALDAIRLALDERPLALPP